MRFTIPRKGQQLGAQQSNLAIGCPADVPHIDASSLNVCALDDACACSLDASAGSMHIQRRPATGSSSLASRRGDSVVGGVAAGVVRGSDRPARDANVPVGSSGGGTRGGMLSAMSTMSAPTSKEPHELMNTAMAVASLQKDMVVTLQSPFIARCIKNGLEFLLEVAATDATQTYFVIRLQLHRGQAVLFREVAARILAYRGCGRMNE